MFLGFWPSFFLFLSFDQFLAIIVVVVGTPLCLWSCSLLCWSVHVAFSVLLWRCTATMFGSCVLVFWHSLVPVVILCCFLGLLSFWLACCNGRQSLFFFCVAQPRCFLLHSSCCTGCVIVFFLCFPARHVCLVCVDRLWVGVLSSCCLHFVILFIVGASHPAFIFSSLFHHSFSCLCFAVAFLFCRGTLCSSFASHSHDFLFFHFVALISFWPLLSSFCAFLHIAMFSLFSCLLAVALLSHLNGSATMVIFQLSFQSSFWHHHNGQFW